MELITIADVIKFVNEYWDRIGDEEKRLFNGWAYMYLGEDGEYHTVSSDDNTTSTGDF